MPNTTVPAAGEAMPGAEVTPITGRFSRRLLEAVLGRPAGAPVAHEDALLITEDDSSTTWCVMFSEGLCDSRRRSSNSTASAGRSTA